MNNMEEKLWNYIDGTCNEEECAAISALIENDDKWRSAFDDMLQTNSDISALSLDEPPMAFSYNVMEVIRAHEASKPLKTSVNKYVISAIAGFFILAMIALVLFLLNNTSGSAGTSVPSTNVDLSIFTNSNLIKVFFYIDAMLLLFLTDAFIRRKRNNAAVKSV